MSAKFDKEICNGVVSIVFTRSLHGRTEPRTHACTDRRTEPQQRYYIPNATRCAGITSRRFENKYVFMPWYSWKYIFCQSPCCKSIIYPDNFSKTLSPQRTPSPHSNIFQHFKTHSFFVLKNNYIVVLSQQSVDWIFDFSFSESGTSTCSSVYSNSKGKPNFCENSQV